MFIFDCRRKPSQSSDVEDGPADDIGKLYVIEVCRVQYIVMIKQLSAGLLAMC